MNISRLTLCGAFAAALLTLAQAPARAYDYNGTPAASLILEHTPGQIQQRILNGWRPTSIELESVVGPVFRVNYIQNTGVHFQQVRCEGPATWAQIQAFQNAGWRTEDIEYVGPGLSVIMIRNVVNPRTTLPFWGWSSDQVINWVNTHPGFRILDLDRYPGGSADVYSGVFLQNTGSAFAPGWGWGLGWAYADIQSWVATNKMRVIDLDRRPDGNYTWVAVSRKPGERYYYFGNRTMTQVLDLLGGVGLRAQTLNETMYNGQRRYSGTAVNNVGSQAARLADLAAPRNNGVQGFFLKQIGGSTIVDLNASRSMHPSSTIKVLLHFTGVELTDTSILNVKLLKPWINMQLAHSLMMWNSDNFMANLIMGQYGVFMHEAVGHSTIGMSNTTQINNEFGTGGPYNNDPYTTTTLVDLGKIYEKVNSGHFNATKDAWFRSNMLNQSNSSLFNTVLNSVRNDIGITAVKFNDYVSRIRFIWKAGNNSDNGVNGYWSCAGMVSLPRKSAGVVVSPRVYEFGHFVNHSTQNYDSTPGFEATRELLREQIRETMLTFK